MPAYNPVLAATELMDQVARQDAEIRSKNKKIKILSVSLIIFVVLAAAFIAASFVRFPPPAAGSPIVINDFKDGKVVVHTVGRIDSQSDYLAFVTDGDELKQVHTEAKLAPGTKVILASLKLPGGQWTEFAFPLADR